MFSACSTHVVHFLETKVSASEILLLYHRQVRREGGDRGSGPVICKVTGRGVNGYPLEFSYLGSEIGYMYPGKHGPYVKFPLCPDGSVMHSHFGP